jgi:hypothetical protein
MTETNLEGVLDDFTAQLHKLTHDYLAMVTLFRTEGEQSVIPVGAYNGLIHALSKELGYHCARMERAGISVEAVQEVVDMGQAFGVKSAELMDGNENTYRLSKEDAN